MKTLFYTVIFLLFLYIVLGLFGCTPGQRMARIIKKHPELAIKDTVRISDTTIVKGSTVDSLFIFSGDTITVSDSNQTIKYFYNNVTHKHYIKGEVRDREVVKEIKVPYVKYILPKKSWWDTYQGYIIVILLSVIAIFAFKRK